MTNRKIATLVATVLLSIALSAQETAKVVFYRYRAFRGSITHTTINVDGKRVCSLANGRFFEITLPVGEHTFTGPNKTKGARLNLEAGKTYYFLTIPDKGTFRSHIWAIAPVPSAQGAFEVQSLKPLDRDDIAPQYRR